MSALLPSAETRLSCGSEWHRLRWDSGDLVALDHADPDGERVIAALGGDRPPCVAVLDAWARHRRDLRVLVVAGRGLRDPLWFRLHELGFTQFGGQSAALSGLTAHPAGLGRVYGLSKFAPTEDLQGGVSLLRLLSLGAVSDRLVATVARTWSDRLATGTVSPSVLPRLHAALAGRATQALRTWLDPRADVAVTLAAPGEEPDLTLADDGGVAARLPFAWVADVWASGLTTVLGRFTLAVTGDDPYDLLTVGRDGDRRTVRIFG